MFDIIDFLETHKWLFDGVGGALVLAVIGGIARIVYCKLFKQNNADPKVIQVAGDYGINTHAGGDIIINNSNNFGGKKNV